MGNHVHCATVQHRIARLSKLDLWRKYGAKNWRPRVKMVGECEIDVLVLPEGHHLNLTVSSYSAYISAYILPAAAWVAALLA